MCLNQLWLDSEGRSNLAVLLGRVSILLFLTILPLTHNAAGKNLALLGMFVSVAGLVWQRRFAINWRSPLMFALTMLFLVLLLTAAFGTEPFESLNELRKHFLPGIMMLALIPLLFRGHNLITLLLSVLALGMLLRSGLVIVELAKYYPDLEAGRSHGIFIKGFALDAVFYLPVLLGLMLTSQHWRWPAGFAIAAVIVVIVLLGGRASLLVAFASLSVFLIALKRWRVFLTLALATIFGAVVIAISQPQLANRFSSIVEPQTYIGVEGLSSRTPIWNGVIEIVRERPITGYGFGWKKLGKIAMENGYVERWLKQSDDPYAKFQAWYFALPADKVNPHNLYLQICFESGLIGLAAYLIALAILFWVAFTVSQRGNEKYKILGAMALSYLVGHTIMGLANGLWLGHGPSFALLALLDVEGHRISES